MKIIRRKTRLILIQFFLIAYSSSSLATINVVSIHATQPKKFSEKQCKAAFEPRLFAALKRYPPSQVVATPDRKVTIGPRQRNAVSMGKTGDKYLLTRFITYFNLDSSKSSTGKSDYIEAPSFLLARMDNSNLAFLSTIYCDAILHSDGGNKEEGVKK